MGDAGSIPSTVSLRAPGTFVEPVEPRLAQGLKGWLFGFRAEEIWVVHVVD